MSKYLRRYNEKTGKWEIVSPTSTDDICVSNTSFNSEEVPMSRLTDVLNNIGSDIDRLKRNVSWLAEHGGSGGGIGIGGGSASNYKITVVNAGITNDTLYVNQPKFSVVFKIAGGTVNDIVEYRAIYDGTYLNSNYTKIKANTNISIDINDIEMFSKMAPHTLIIEAIDTEGNAIPSYTLSIIETSIKVTCPASNILTIGSSGMFDLFITNKILNSTTSIKVTNTSVTGYEYNYSYTSTNAGETIVPIDFYKFLIDEASVEVGKTYTLKIEVQTTTSDGTPINATPIYTTIMIQGSNKIVINLQSLTTQEAFDADKINGTQFAVGGNITFGFTPYLIDNLTTYYAVQLESAAGSSNNTLKINIVGDYDCAPEDYNKNEAMLTGKLKTISWNIPKNETYIGEWLVKIKCWSSSGLIVNEVIGKCRIINSNVNDFPTQVPIRGNVSTVGNTRYAYWDLSTISSNTAKSKEWNSTVVNYLPPTATNEEETTTVSTIMNIHNTNGEENGFLVTPTNRLRLSSEAYATIDTDIDSTWVERDGFTISITFKTDYHPYNDRTVFFLGNVDSKGEFYNGMKIDLEHAYWYFISTSSDGKEVSHKIDVPIRQNALNTIDFVYKHNKKADGTNEGMAKVFVNGKIYSAVEADNYTSLLPSRIYLGCAYSSYQDKIYNYADVDITSLQIFSKSLNDMEIVVNSHNARAERDENNNIIPEKYNEWKQRNYFIENEENKPISYIYNLVESDYKYVCPGYVSLKGSNPPLPILWLDGSGSDFLRDTYESTSHPESITDVKYPGFKMFYYDPNANNGKGQEVQADDIAVSIQGTSTTTLRSKNLEIYFTKELEGYNDGRVQLFQPKDDWFPESQFTLKADVVDSAHANNATLGRWINTEAARTILEDTPPMSAVKKNPPRDVVKGNDGQDISFPIAQTLPTVKHTLEGFPIILMITFGQETAPEMLGIYSFNLGRFSYYNMGLSFFKSFSRRSFKEEKNEWVDESAPALINHYDFYQRTEEFEGIKMNEIFSYEFGSDGDRNEVEHNAWSQDRKSILKKMGEFKFNGLNGDSSAPEEKAWDCLQRLFYATARMPEASDVYEFDGYKFVNTGEKYTADLNVASELLVKRLSIKNAVAYYVIANAFGMVDSLGKNLTLRSWNARYNGSEDDIDDINKWYPCFYDMDTALGLTNAGDENVSSTVYMDLYKNNEIIDGVIQPNNLIIERNVQQDNGFGAFNSKIWNILRSTAANGDPSHFVTSGKWTGPLYEETWRLLRKEGEPLSSENLFVDLFTQQTQGCGELLFNLDYNVKYLTKYVREGIEAYGNIKMLHGDRVEYIRNWLKDRFYFLDAVFEVANVTDTRLPYYTKGYITCGGPVGGGHPELIFNTTSPTILTVEIGQNGQIFKYMLPAYKDTKVIMPPLSSDSKRIGINSTTLLTKMDGLKDIRFQKFESMSLPKFSQIDLSNVTTLSTTDPVEFETVFLRNENGIKTSDIRDINLYNALGTNSFAVTVKDYSKIKRIDIRNSCVTSISLPSAPLSDLQFSNSQIVGLTIDSQPYLDILDFTGCSKLQNVNLYECDNIGELNISNLNLLSSLSVAECDKITKIDCSGNKELTQLTIEGLPNLTEIDLSDCTNVGLSISIKNCNALQKINLQGVKTKTPILLPFNVSNVTTLNLEGCSNLTGFKFGEASASVNKYNGEDVLDLRPFTALSSTGLTINNCANLKYVKFNNEQDKPYELTSNFFSGCSSLVNVFGNLALNGTGIFSGCTKYYIFELPADEVTPMPEEGKFNETTSENDGNVTNMIISGTSLSSCFRQTNCNLYDVYYVLQKCDKVTNLSSCFYQCKNVKATLKNSLNKDIFLHCGRVTNMSSLFYQTGIGGVLKSPVLSGTTIKENGILTPCYSLTNFSTTFNTSSTLYIDDKFFYKCKNATGGTQNLKITTITYFSPQIVMDSNNSSLAYCDTSNISEYYGYASSENLLTYLSSLTGLSYSFNNSRYLFKDNKFVTKDNKNYYYTDLFYNNKNLRSIANSFSGITGSGALRNLFGGYKGTIADTSHFPQSLSAITNSFIINAASGDTNVVLYLGDSFLQKIKNSITNITGSQAGSNTATATSSFNGDALTKRVDNEDNDGAVAFPYKIFNGCTKLKEIPALFKGLTRGDDYEGDVITLPTYVDEYGNTRSMFEGLKNLTNIAYLFAYMKDIKYVLKGNGFKDCALINVNSAFAETSANNNINGNKEGCIPYGLFLQEQEASFTTVSGLTAEDAEELGIVDETYGIINCQFDSEGKVIVRFDNEGNVISGATYPDGTQIQHVINDKGIVLDGTNGTEEVFAEEYYPLPVAMTTHGGKYKTHKTTITNIGSIFEYSTSKNLEPYRYDIDINDIVYDETSRTYKCPDLVLDNENYNPIKYFINPNFDPHLMVWDDANKRYVQNPLYDPRRILLNKNYNIYKKKWNKWVADGTDILAEKILDSELYAAVQSGEHKDLPTELPVELMPGYISQDAPLPTDINNFTSERFNTRAYFCPPDIFRYCKNADGTVVTKVFNECGGPDPSSPNYDDNDYMDYSLYGVIPPYLFEPISNITDISYMFYRVKGLLPYKWSDGVNAGIMYPPQLFTGMKKLKIATGLFGYNHIYNRCKVDNTQFSMNSELRDVNNLFYNTIWGSSNTFVQVEDSMFMTNKNLANVSYMFYSSDSIGSNRLPRVMSSNLFSTTNNPKISNCSYFMYNGQQTSGSVPEFWKWPSSTMKTTTGCYRNITTSVSNYGSIPQAYK